MPRSSLLIVFLLVLSVQPVGADQGATVPEFSYLRTVGFPPLGAADMYPSGIDASPNGDFVAVADTGNDRVLVYNLDGSQRIPPFGGYGTVPGRLDFPRDVAIDVHGNIYVADKRNNRIQEFDSSGQFLELWRGTRPDGSTWFTSALGLDVDDSGIVWVADAGSSQIAAFDPIGGRLLVRFGGRGSGPGQFRQPRDVTANSYAVYVADSGNGRVQMFTRTGEFIREWGSLGAGDSQFGYPYGVTTDSEGHVYVLDSPSAEVQIFDKDGFFLDRVGVKGKDAAHGELWQPRRVAVDPSGNIYVANMWGFSVEKYGPYQVPGQPIPWLQVWGGTPAPPEGFNQVYDVAIAPGGDIYAIDYVNNRVQVYDPTGIHLLSWGERGAALRFFHWPQGIGVDKVGDAYVVDSGDHRVKKFTADGTKLLQVYGAWGSQPGRFKKPSDVAIDGEGNLYVADHDNGRVQKLSPTGEVLLILGSSVGPGKLLRPAALALDANSNVYVADEALDVVKEYAPDGAFVRQIGTGQGGRNGQMRSPKGVAVTSGGEIIVADTGNNRLQVFDSGGVFRATFGRFGQTTDAFYGPAGLEIGAGGRLYVADTYNSRIQVFDLVE